MIFIGYTTADCTGIAAELATDLVLYSAEVTTAFDQWLHSMYAWCRQRCLRVFIVSQRNLECLSQTYR
jgi:hypothetical protein